MKQRLLKSSRTIEQAGGKAKGIVADLTKDEDSKRIVLETAKHFNGLDFVWNHVGVPGPASVEGIVLGDTAWIATFDPVADWDKDPIVPNIDYSGFEII